MTPPEVAATAATVALQATRLLKASQPLWQRMPDWLQAALPVFMLALPKLAEQAGLVQTNMDLAELAVLAVVAVLPGLHTRKRDEAAK